MSGKGNCKDTSTVESFFKSLKAELAWRRNWQSQRAVKVALFEYIIGFLQPAPPTFSLGLEMPRGL